MTDVSKAIASYSRAFNREFLQTHGVASPLGLWLLLALIGPEAEGADRDALSEILGLEVGAARDAAIELLENPHPAVLAACAAWARPEFLSQRGNAFAGGLPGVVESGYMPDQAAADQWAADRTMGMIGEFPLQLRPDTALVLTSALATDVTWREPFEEAEFTELGGEFGEQNPVVLASASDHICLITDTESAGLVGVHSVDAASGLRVISVIAGQGVDPGDVHSAAAEVAAMLGGDDSRARVRSLFDLPLGDGLAWTIDEREHTLPWANSDRVEWAAALLPEWTARQTLDLSKAPGLVSLGPALNGMLAEALHGEPSAEVRQSAFASYTRLGFRAAAVTAIGMRSAGMPQPRTVTLRTATITFNRPYAAVAVALPATDQGWRPGWDSIPVFSAWVGQTGTAHEKSV